VSVLTPVESADKQEVSQSVAAQLSENKPICWQMILPYKHLWTKCLVYL